TPVHRVLRPSVSGPHSAGLGIDFVAVQPDESPLPGLYADSVERFLAEAQLIKLANGIGLDVDTDAQRFDLRDGLEHEAGHADLMQGQREAQAANASTGDQYWRIGHWTSIKQVMLPGVRWPAPFDGYARRSAPARPSSPPPPR